MRVPSHYIMRISSQTSSVTTAGAPRAPKRARGRQRVSELLAAASAVFAEKGYEAATMTEIAARAGAPIGSLYQFFPVKDALADTLVRNYAGLLTADLRTLEGEAGRVDTRALVESLFRLLRAHARERAAALPLVDARMDERTRRTTFRYVFRRHIAAVLRAHAPALPAPVSRNMALVVLQLMKAASMLSDEEGLPGRVTALRELQELAVLYLERRLRAGR
jgi:AcrR family transcriptional regulator